MVNLGSGKLGACAEMFKMLKQASPKTDTTGKNQEASESIILNIAKFKFCRELNGLRYCDRYGFAPGRGVGGS